MTFKATIPLSLVDLISVEIVTFRATISCVRKRTCLPAASQLCMQ